MTPAERLSALVLGAVGLAMSAACLAATGGLVGWGGAEDAAAVVLQGLTGRA